MIEIKTLASSSKGNAYLVTDGLSPLLIECGINWKEIQRKLDFKTSEIKGCLISHEHNDHCKAWREVSKAGIPIFASRGTIEGARMEGHRLEIVKEMDRFAIGTWTVVPFNIQHDCKEPLGFLLVNQLGEKLLFATDTYYVRYLFKDLTHIMVECNYSEDILADNVEQGYISESMKNRLLQSHFSLSNVKEFLRANDLSKVQEIHLLHLSDGNSDTERFKKEVQELTGKPVYVAESEGTSGCMSLRNATKKVVRWQKLSG